MAQNHGKVALVTGASSGIGQACAKLLAQDGWLVYGTSRQIQKGIVEDRFGIHMVQLDVTDQESVQAAVSIVLEREGRLDALVNNAGFGIAGAVEDTEIHEAVAQFNTNFFGALSMCREALPALMKTKGIIINISTMAAKMPVPYQAMYCASKAALEAVSESLRIEQRPFGVRVTIVEPGDTHTGFTAMRRITATVSPQYEVAMRHSVTRMEKDEQNGVPPEKVARVVCRMARRKNPPVRVAVGFIYKLFAVLKRLLPERAANWIVGLIYG